MYFDVSVLDAPRSYKLLTATVVPRPIAWWYRPMRKGASTPHRSRSSTASAPPAGGLRRRRQPQRRSEGHAGHIEARREFVVNLVPEALAEAMNDTATDFPSGHDELQAAGLATAPSSKVGVPRIAASPVALECRLKQVIAIEPIATSWWPRWWPCTWRTRP
jgi:hypothetical protein